MDPHTSRWQSADPAGFNLANPMKKNNKGELVAKENFSIIESTNWYTYCSNNPVKYVDPSGMWQDNEDGTYTAEEVDTLWELYGDDWQEKSGYTGDPKDLQVGAIVGQKEEKSNISKTENSKDHDLLIPGLDNKSESGIDLGIYDDFEQNAEKGNEINKKGVILGTIGIASGIGGIILSIAGTAAGTLGALSGDDTTSPAMVYISYKAFLGSVAATAFGITTLSAAIKGKEIDIPLSLEGLF